MNSSDGSLLYDQMYYTTSHRGQAMYGDISWGMFPEKTEETEIMEDPFAVERMQRDTLRDFGPDNNTLFADSQPRRDTHSKEKIALREHGARSAAYPDQNPDFDTQFHDKDPRVWSTEIPWDNYRKLAEKHMENFCSTN